MLRLIIIFSFVCAAVNLITVAQASEPDLIKQYRSGIDAWPVLMHEVDVTIPELAPLTMPVIFPENNPYSDAKYTLGKQLFFERRLSGSQQIACASCHDPDLGWADGRRKTIGHNRIQGSFNSPSVVNSGYLTELFWDGRATSLEQQILASWRNPIEMAASPELVIQKISEIETYHNMFSEAFDNQEISPSNIVDALATFMRSLTTPPSRFDSFMHDDPHALNEQEIRGLHLFRTQAKCILCHNGALLTDNKFHHLGTSFHNVGEFQGRYRLTGLAEDVGAFRTPSLRVGLVTPPFMHNGLVPNLDMLLSLYNAGWWQNAELEDKGNNIPTATLSPLIQPLNLTDDELADLKAFLFSLESHLPVLPISEALH